MRHILSAKQFTKDEIETLLDKAHCLSKHSGTVYNARGRVVNFFCEPSTRTRISFDAAAQSLGLQVLTIADKEGSSVSKGESLEDTIRVLGRYSDCIVIRHEQSFAAEQAARVSTVPIINAGDGSNEHPTQALLDLFTISKYRVYKPGKLATPSAKRLSFPAGPRRRLDGVKVLIVGDLKYGRTVHSLIHILQHYKAKIFVASDRQLALPKEFNGLPITVTDMQDGSPHPRTTEVLKEVDVVYMTRVQTERNTEQGGLKDAYPIKITPHTIGMMKKNAIVMHPGPRNYEISPAVDEDPRMVMFDQAENGLYMRMAILNYVMGLNMV